MMSPTQAVTTHEDLKSKSKKETRNDERHVSEASAGVTMS